MRHLEYTHTHTRSLVETLVGGIARCLTRRLLPQSETAGRSRFGRRAAVLLVWVLALAVQAVLLVLVSELVELVHGVMTLYLDLAEQQLELTSLYVAATSPDPRP